MAGTQSRAEHAHTHTHTHTRPDTQKRDERVDGAMAAVKMSAVTKGSVPRRRRRPEPRRPGRPARRTALGNSSCRRFSGRWLAVQRTKRRKKTTVLGLELARDQRTETRHCEERGTGATTGCRGLSRLQWRGRRRLVAAAQEKRPLGGSSVAAAAAAAPPPPPPGSRHRGDTQSHRPPAHLARRPGMRFRRRRRRRRRPTAAPEPLFRRVQARKICHR